MIRINKNVKNNNYYTNIEMTKNMSPETDPFEILIPLRLSIQTSAWVRFDTERRVILDVNKTTFLEEVEKFLGEFIICGITRDYDRDSILAYIIMMLVNFRIFNFQEAVDYVDCIVNISKYNTLNKILESISEKDTSITEEDYDNYLDRLSNEEISAPSCRFWTLRNTNPVLRKCVFKQSLKRNESIKNFCNNISPTELEFDAIREYKDVVKGKANLSSLITYFTLNKDISGKYADVLETLKSKTTVDELEVLIASNKYVIDGLSKNDFDSQYEYEYCIRIFRHPGFKELMSGLILSYMIQYPKEGKVFEALTLQLFNTDLFKMLPPILPAEENLDEFCDLIVRVFDKRNVTKVYIKKLFNNSSGLFMSKLSKYLITNRNKYPNISKKIASAKMDSKL